MPPHIDVLWADARVEQLIFDFDAVTLHITEDTGRRVLLRCEGQIGFHVDWFWDEMIIERAELLSSDPRLDACIARLPSGADTGNEARDQRQWLALRVHLIDGCEIEVFAARFQVVAA